MPEDIDPSAQGPQPEAGSGSNGQENQANGEVSQGIQKRFDEFTAKLRESERTNVALQAKLDQTTQQMAALFAARNEQPAEKVEVDPEEAAKIHAVVGPEVARLRTQAAQYEQEILRMQVAGLASLNGLSSEQTEQALNIALHLKRSGTPFLPLDAVKFVVGGVALEERQRNVVNRNSVREFNAGGTSLMGTRSAPNMNPEKPLPANFDDLPPDQQAALLEQRLGDKTF